MPDATDSTGPRSRARARGERTPGGRPRADPGRPTQGELTDEEWRDLITPGTPIHERWKSQVDVIAWHLRQLRDAGVPVLWRPYHEMNGEWFWWGQKPGDGGYKKLYRMLFERLAVFHGLSNLVWVWNANEIRESDEVLTLDELPWTKFKEPRIHSPVLR